MTTTFNESKPFLMHTSLKRSFLPGKKPLLLLSLLFIVSIAAAQQANKDSLSLVTKISADKEKLTQLQNSLPDKEKAKKDAVDKAQQSADENRQAANDLSNKPQDKKLAKKAHNSAHDARNDAKKARQATENLEDLEKDIRKLTKKIGKEEAKLKKHVDAAAKAQRMTIPVQTPDIKADSTRTY